VIEKQTDARVDAMGDGSDSPTASEDVAGSDRPSIPNQVSNVLRELDSYRRAIREAFDEGYAASSNRMPIEHAWERSEARQAEWGFAHTRMSVGAVVNGVTSPTWPCGCNAASWCDRHRPAIFGGNQPPSDVRGDPGASRTVNAPARDQSSSSLAHPEPGWQPIESAPKDGTEILGYTPGFGGIVEVVKWNENDSIWEYAGEYSMAATHWMPLPLPPAPTEQEQP
jgi:hypothetical protein